MERGSLYWTRCVAHFPDLILENIAELLCISILCWEQETLQSHLQPSMIAWTRMFVGKYFLWLGYHMIMTAYLTLESMDQLKQPLQSMSISNEWAGCAWAKKDERKAVKKIIMDEYSFWHNTVYSSKTIGPFVCIFWEWFIVRIRTRKSNIIAQSMKFKKQINNPKEYKWIEETNLFLLELWHWQVRQLLHYSFPFSLQTPCQKNSKYFLEQLIH